ncbi:hypothetical protein F5890DRAFT_1503712 [Lentinula detonsa]|uniref:Uncharacterized protein n=1 Tax=Lentinula detonsa TaxID=2804962 RepID=A0AA38UTM8_9AGAR|nr:hypothetical protein F5890DRAFT_1503712 [Lentinula detonsa]
MDSKALSSKPSTLASFTNYFRPHRGEAVVRLRSNAFGLVSVFISTWLLPVPSVVSAMRMLLSGNNARTGFLAGNGSEWNVRKAVCLLELTIVAMLIYNVLEALYALQYPRKPLPPSGLSPAKKSNPLGIFSPESAKKPFRILSPNSTPTSASKFQFFSPSQTLALSESRSSQYPPSPVSSPSRVIRYSMPPKGGSSEGGVNASILSSTSTIPPTPSPSSTLASAYRGKHSSSFHGGRPMDGLFLSQITLSGDADDEEEEE